MHPSLFRDTSPSIAFRLRRSALLALLSFAAAGVLLVAGLHPAEDQAEAEGVPALEREWPADLSGPYAGNERVQKWLRRFGKEQKHAFEQVLGRGGVYSGMIRAKLRSRGMPEELLYLAMIESNFSPRATSDSAAAGVWQFMGPTARERGLRVDSWVDERRDPVRATDAALDYLQALHDRFGSWYLAAAAYNAGPNRVASVLRAHGTERGGDEELYWEIIDHLPHETRDYVPKLLAASLVARNATGYGLRVEWASPYLYDQVFVPGGTPLTVVARTLQVPMGELRNLNPHLIRGVTPPGLTYPVRIPVGDSERLVANFERRRSVLSAD